MVNHTLPALDSGPKYLERVEGGDEIHIHMLSETSGLVTLIGTLLHLPMLLSNGHLDGLLAIARLDAAFIHKMICEMGRVSANGVMKRHETYSQSQKSVITAHHELS